MATAEQYAEWIVNNQDKKGSEQYNTVTQAYKEVRGMPQQPAEQPPQEEQGFLGNVADKISSRGEQFGKDMAGVGEDLLTVNPLQTLAAGQRGIRRIGGFAAGAGADILGEGIASIADAVTPEFIQEGVKDAMQYVAGSPVGGAAKSVAEIYAGFKNKNPELAQSIADTANMAGFVTGGSLLKKPLKEVGEEIASITPQSAAKKEIAQKLLSEDNLSRELAKFEIKPQTKTEKLLGMDQKVKTDPLAKETIKQGFDPAVIQSVKTGSKADKLAMKRMVGIAERTKDNAEFGLSNRPTDIVGDSLLKRFRVVKDKNTQAGKSIGKVVQSISKKPFDAQKIESSFIESLNDMGVKIGRNTKGEVKLDFKGSDVAGIKGLEKSLTDVVDRMSDSPFPTTGQAHKLKKYLDEKISYDKVNSGLQGKTENVLTKLRSSINNEIKDKSPRYATVNKVYAETVDALDELQVLAGKKNDILGDGGASMLGQKLRGIMSNNVSRTRLIDAYKNIEKLSNKYGGKFNDSIEKQVLFADELDKVFKPAGRTSFQGQIGQALERTAQATATGGASTIMRGVSNVADKIHGVNEKKKLLREGK